MGERKAKLAKLVSRVAGGIHFNEHIDGDGAVIFDHACRLGLGGIVSKRCDLPYGAATVASRIFS